MKNNRVQSPSCSKAGFTLLELLVVIVIVGLLVSLTLGAVQTARESSRRLQCVNNLKQLGVAVLSYEATHRVLPPGMSNGYSTHTFLLPHLEQKPLFDCVNFSTHPKLSGSDPCNLLTTRVSVFQCPSDPANDDTGMSRSTNYVVNYGTGVQTAGYNGAFNIWGSNYKGLSIPLRIADFTDGASQTAAIAETLVGDGSPRRLRSVWILPKAILGASQLDQFAASCAALATATGSEDQSRGRPWSSGQIYEVGYNHVLPPNSPNCINGNFPQEGSYAASSLHPSGVNVLHVDGHVRAAAANVSVSVWRAMGSRNGREIVSLQ